VAGAKSAGRTVRGGRVFQQHAQAFDDLIIDACTIDDVTKDRDGVEPTGVIENRR
jgi:hypothetical protein